MIDKQLKKYNIDQLHYIVHLRNMPSIFAQGILCHERVQNLDHYDFSNASVQRRRRRQVPKIGKEIHRYVPLFFTTHTPMQYILITNAPTKGRKQSLSQEELVIIEINANRVFQLEGVFFTDGNAASKQTKFYSDVADLDKLDWDIIHLPNEYPQCYNSDYQRKKASEVLVPDHVPIGFFDHIVVYSQDALIALKNQTNCYCVIDRSHYF
ncbi:MAG: DUF4433 domain-containing protein [Dehalococcoidia bacterium]|nr:DUF4433 domain-containing protein [Dehalococcoidia bacterium]